MTGERIPRKRGTIPGYWWDFNDAADALIVETDDPRVPGGIVETVPFIGFESCDAADAIVAYFKSGRRRYCA